MIFSLPLTPKGRKNHQLVKVLYFLWRFSSFPLQGAGGKMKKNNWRQFFMGKTGFIDNDFFVTPKPLKGEKIISV
jgi:hypothetical protein